MHRLLVDSAELGKDAPTLSHEAANHLKVLRPKDGEEIELFDGRGRWRVYNYETATKTLRAAGDSRPYQQPTTNNQQPTTNYQLTLFACVTKGSRWDWTIEKATELGVTRIVPVISERTIVRIPKDERAAKRERWMRIAEESARQSDAKWLPEIVEPVDFVDTLPIVRETNCFVGALTNPPPKTIGEELGNRKEELGNSAECLVHSVANAPSTKHQAPSTKHYSVFVGPEGDFTPAELSALLEIATPVSFGSTILRAETAAIYGISVLKSWLDRYRPSTSQTSQTSQTLQTLQTFSMYKLVEIFKSLQGEGRNAGRPCVFVRFAGCNLACPWCDTDIAERFSLSLADLVAEIKSHDCKSVILTGGEPTCVAEMDVLVDALKADGFWVAVETNGTNVPSWLGKVDYVACSPKTEYADRLKLTRADEVRVVTSSEATVDFCRTVREKISATDYYVSPCDHDGEIDFATAKSVLGQLKGWSLSVQLHKLMGFR